jgi:short-subunit dehydrogenase
LRWFGRAIDDELRERGIAVRTVSPGPVDTDFFLDELDRVTPMTFSQPMSTPEEVAEAVMRAILEGPQEIGMPKKGARLATLGYLSPGFLRILRPRLERKGARAKAAYAARRGGGSGKRT